MLEKFNRAISENIEDLGESNGELYIREIEQNFLHLKKTLLKTKRNSKLNSVLSNSKPGNTLSRLPLMCKNLKERLKESEEINASILNEIETDRDYFRNREKIIKKLEYKSKCTEMKEISFFIPSKFRIDNEELRLDKPLEENDIEAFKSLIQPIPKPAHMRERIKNESDDSLSDNSIDYDLFTIPSENQINRKLAEMLTNSYNKKDLTFKIQKIKNQNEKLKTKLALEKEFKSMVLSVKCLINESA